MKFDQDVCLNFWNELNPRVHCSFGNVFLILPLCLKVHHKLLEPIKSQTNLQVFLDLEMDDLKGRHLSISQILNICKFMLVALIYCKFMSGCCQFAWPSNKQRFLHTKIVCRNLPLSLSHCMHSEISLKCKLAWIGDFIFPPTICFLAPHHGFLVEFWKSPFH